MAWSDPVDPTAGTVITVAAYVSNSLDNIRWLRLLTGNSNPPGSAYVVVSTGPTGTSWQKISDDVLVDHGISGDTKLAFGSVTGNSGGSAIAVGAIHANRIQAASFDATQIAAAFAAHAIDGDTYLGLSSVTGNSGTSAIGINAIHGNRLIAGTVTAENALALGGSAAALYALLASPALTGSPTINADAIAVIKIGTYNGAGASGTQVTSGFACKLVAVIGVSGTAAVVHLLCSTVAASCIRIAGPGGLGAAAINRNAQSRLHASDGFITDSTEGTDTVGYAYVWIALG